VLGAGLVGCALGCYALCLRRPVQAAQQRSGQETTKTQVDPAALAEGQSLFRGLCSGCHGGAGRGGKGPDLTRKKFSHGSRDEDIVKVIRNGVPKTTMKKLGDSLKDDQIAKLVLFIRSLQSAPAGNTWKPYLAGNPKVGRQLFFDPKGKGQCAKCHSVDGEGGRIGPALDRIASRRAPEFIMESILQPSKDIDPQYETLRVVTKTGVTLVGLRVNQTNFSVQVREVDGRFHSFDKSELDEVTVLKKSLMPEDFAEQLSVKELHDLFAYLMSLE
jgi:putative heme-binding domain-containing protein